MERRGRKGGTWKRARAQKVGKRRDKGVGRLEEGWRGPEQGRWESWARGLGEGEKPGEGAGGP